MTNLVNGLLILLIIVAYIGWVGIGFKYVATNLKIPVLIAVPAFAFWMGLPFVLISGFSS